MASDPADSNESLWWTTKPPYDPLPPLKSSIKADIAILGGGFTGVSSALHFKKRFPEKKIVLVEAAHLGAGASGRNGGLMLNWVNGIHTDDVASAKRIFDATKMGIDLIESMIEEHNLDVSYRRDGCIEAFTDDARAQAAKKSAAELNAGGIPIEFVEGSELEEYIQFDGVKGGIVDPTAGQIDGVDLLRGLRPVLTKLGVEIYEGTPVVGILEGPAIQVKTKEG